MLTGAHVSSFIINLCTFQLFPLKIYHRIPLVSSFWTTNHLLFLSRFFCFFYSFEVIMQNEIGFFFVFFLLFSASKCSNGVHYAAIIRNSIIFYAYFYMFLHNIYMCLTLQFLATGYFCCVFFCLYCLFIWAYSFSYAILHIKRFPCNLHCFRFRCFCLTGRRTVAKWSRIFLFDFSCLLIRLFVHWLILLFNFSFSFHAFFFLLASCPPSSFAWSQNHIFFCVTLSFAHSTWILCYTKR